MYLTILPGVCLAKDNMISKTKLLAHHNQCLSFNFLFFGVRLRVLNAQFASLEDRPTSRDSSRAASPHRNLPSLHLPTAPSRDSGDFAQACDALCFTCTIISGIQRALDGISRVDTTVPHAGRLAHVVTLAFVESHKA